MVKRATCNLAGYRLIVELRSPTGTLSLYMEHWKNHADKGKSKDSVKSLSQRHSINADVSGQKFNEVTPSSVETCLRKLKTAQLTSYVIIFFTNVINSNNVILRR